MHSLQVLLLTAVLLILSFGGGWYGHYQYGSTQTGDARPDTAPDIAPGLHLIDPTSLREVPAAIKEAPLRALLQADVLAAAATPAGSLAAGGGAISRPRPVKHSDFVWLSPKPSAARKVGWEDEWMMKWKTEQYRKGVTAGCRHQPDKCPYQGGILCDFPKYIPARIAATELATQRIPRVFFVCWLTPRLGRAGYMRMMSLLNTHPGFEMVFFTDEDIDRFVCENFPANVSAPLSSLRAGAARADLWRLLVMQRYGGVYIDFDVAVLSPLPIGPEDDVVSGTGGWGHLPSGVGGVLEHWAMAFSPSHAIINIAIDKVIRNMAQPYDPNGKEKKGDASHTIATTGPGPYQEALHQLLAEAKCKLINNNYVQALLNAEDAGCDVAKLHELIGNWRFFPGVLHNNSITDKILDHFLDELNVMNRNYDYDAPDLTRTAPVDAFCTDVAIRARQAERDRIWDHTKRHVP